MSVPQAGHTAEAAASPQLLADPSRDPELATAPSTPPNQSEKETTVLDWDGPSDPLNPANWSISRKWLTVGTALLATFLVPLNGTSITVAAAQINSEFNVSDATFPHSYWPMTSWSLGGALFIILFLPLMEDIGVRRGFMLVYLIFLLMIVGQAVATNFATLVVTRFFSGGCVALLANTISSVIPDLWQDDRQRSAPVGLYIMLYLTGSTIGPPMFAGVMQYIGNWRWIFYIQLILYAAVSPLFILLLRETRATVLLRRRAAALRKSTGKAIYTQHELSSPPLAKRLAASITRPTYLLFTEPVLIASTCWSAFSFGTVFLFTQSVEQVFGELYGWGPYSASYVQGAVVIGELIGWPVAAYGSHLWLKSAKSNVETPGRPIPEARLYVSVPASFLGIVGGMLVYAWTSYPTIHWMAPAIGLAMVGFGIQVVVTAVADYITDAYAPSGYAGSAVSAVAAGENVVAAFLPLAAKSLYGNLGLHWASTLLAGLAFVLGFAPVLFIWKGRWFRAQSPFMQDGKEASEKDAATP